MIPRAPTPASRRFIFGFSTDDRNFQKPTLIWIDEWEACDQHDADRIPLYHVHKFEGPDTEHASGMPHRAPDYKVAYRCPRSLTEEERDRIFSDEPPGAWRRHLSKERAKRIASHKAVASDFEPERQPGEEEDPRPANLRRRAAEKPLSDIIAEQVDEMFPDPPGNTR